MLIRNQYNVYLHVHVRISQLSCQSRQEVRSRHLEQVDPIADRYLQQIPTDKTWALTRNLHFLPPRYTILQVFLYARYSQTTQTDAWPASSTLSFCRFGQNILMIFTRKCKSNAHDVIRIFLHMATLTKDAKHLSNFSPPTLSRAGRQWPFCQWNQQGSWQVGRILPSDNSAESDPMVVACHARISLHRSKHPPCRLRSLRKSFECREAMKVER